MDLASTFIVLYVLHFNPLANAPCKPANGQINFHDNLHCEQPAAVQAHNIESIASLVLISYRYVDDTVVFV